MRRMRKIISFILLSVLTMALIGCGGKEPKTNKTSGGTAPTETKQKLLNSETASTEPKQNQIANDLQKPNNITIDFKTLPETYPKEILPLAADAEIIDIREHPANNGLEVSYVSDNNIDTLCDFYEGALQDAENISTTETPDGYMIDAKMDGIDYTIMLDKNAMNPNPQYAGKISVYIVLIGLEGVSNNASQMPKGDGEAWPFAELPGVPELKGHISQILREDGIIRLELTVESADDVKSYIGKLTEASFSFDTLLDIESDHMEFLAFKDGSMISFAYKGEENAVSIEFQK